MLVDNRKETTAMLSRSIEKHIKYDDPRIYWAKEVTFDYATNHAVRVDYVQFKPVNNSVSGIENGNFYCFEVKSSVEDFRSKNGHNFLGDYNYYVMPGEVYKKVQKEIPRKVGVYVPDGIDSANNCYYLKSVKRAVKSDRTKPVSEMLLMMFRSAVREIRKSEEEV